MQPRQQDESEDLNRTMRILHLEDCETDQELVAALLIDAEIACEITTIQTRMEFINTLRNGPWDLILASYALPGFDGFSALTIAHLLCPNTPFIFVTGAMGEDFAVETLRRGATDYVLKEKMERLGRAVRRALNESAEKARRQRAEAQVRLLAYYDALTGLANRTLLKDRLSQALASACRRKEKVALLFLDLDRFKTINDSLGHSVGDLLLKEVAERLKESARSQDTVSRIGGDEFVIVLTAVKDVAEAIMAADRFTKAITAEFVVQGHSLHITCSLGISIFPDHGVDGESLTRYADAALCRAKDNGRNNFQVFTQNMIAQAMERLTLESSLRVALERKQHFLEYQPQLDLATGKIVGAEALLRWRHPQLGLVSPCEFIPIAESSGMIVPLGEWVLRTACTQAKQWQAEGLALPRISVNVSAVQFRQKLFPAIVGNVLDETGLAPQSLELELTESLLLPGANVMLTVLQQLKDVGLKLSIDDFGTGYSCLSYLRHIPVYKLKIDRSFVQGVTANPEDAAIVDAIIKMAKILNLRVLAEGAETEQQVAFLHAHNCDEIQGYYFSKPLAADDFADKIRSSRSLELPLEAENSAFSHKDALAYPVPTVSQDWTNTAGASG